MCMSIYLTHPLETLRYQTIVLTPPGNCEPRLPVERLQTRKEGVNHGRWCEFTAQNTSTLKSQSLLTSRRSSKVYKCQKPKPKQCKFFLWENEAEPREGSGSRSEPRRPSTPTTPSRNNKTPNSLKRQPGRPITQFNTPQKPPRSPAPAHTTNTPCALTRTPRGWNDGESGVELDEESFEWPLSDEGVMEEDRSEERVAVIIPSTTSSGSQRPLQPSASSMPLPQTPRKAPRTAATTTPGKRARSRSPSALPTSTTPPHTLSTPQINRILFPTSQQQQSDPYSPTSPSPPSIPNSNTLTYEILTLLTAHNITLSPPATAALSHICNTHALRTQGIARGRDVSREALKEKERKIEELKRRVEGLEAERERDRAVIGSLRKERSGRVGEVVGGKVWEDGREW
jgi:hypothetical protein